MHFEIVHDFDIPLDAIELAVLSPGLNEKLAPRLKSIEKLRQKSHTIKGGHFERVWSYKANVKLPGFAKAYVTPEMLSWDERLAYDLKKHQADWIILPQVRPAWRKYFHASGTYALFARGDGTRRVVKGDLELVVPVVRQVAERMIVAEVRKNFEAEAVTLRELATLV